MAAAGLCTAPLAKRSCGSRSLLTRARTPRGRWGGGRLWGRTRRRGEEEGSEERLGLFVFFSSSVSRSLSLASAHFFLSCFLWWLFILFLSLWFLLSVFPPLSSLGVCVCVLIGFLKKSLGNFSVGGWVGIRKKGGGR